MTTREICVDGTYFTFPDGWQVDMFDEWPQFCKAAGALSLKGCDVLALDSDELWIIEVKDYTYANAEQPPDLAKTVALKAAGTMALLYSLARTNADSRAREFAIRCASSTRIHLALHIDVKDGGRRQRQIKPVLPPILTKLRHYQKALGLHKAHVTSTLAPSPSTPWTARRDPATRAVHADR
ncbi:hypothetical protein ACWFMI_22040 [Nocardiopsis terrae]